MCESCVRPLTHRHTEYVNIDLPGTICSHDKSYVLKPLAPDLKFLFKSLMTKLIEGMVRKPIVLSLLFAFDVELVLTVHNVELDFILT